MNTWGAENYGEYELAQMAGAERQRKKTFMYQHKNHEGDTLKQRKLKNVGAREKKVY